MRYKKSIIIYTIIIIIMGHESQLKSTKLSINVVNCKPYGETYLLLPVLVLL